MKLVQYLSLIIDLHDVLCAFVRGNFDVDVSIHDQLRHVLDLEEAFVRAVEQCFDNVRNDQYLHKNQNDSQYYDCVQFVLDLSKG